MTSEFGPVHFSDQQVLELLREVVREAGEDYVYPVNHGTGIKSGNGCHYVRDGEPSCIVGRLCVKMGATTEWLSHYEATGAKFVLGYRGFVEMDPGANERPFRISENMADSLDRGQRKQDNGACWGEILQLVEDMMRTTGALN